MSSFCVEDITHGAVVKQSYPEEIDIFAIGQDKSIAIRKVLEDKGLKPERDLIVFGDSGNDSEMVSSAALGIAMGNCKQVTCDAADVIIGPNYLDSLGKAIRLLALNSTCLAAKD